MHEASSSLHRFLYLCCPDDFWQADSVSGKKQLTREKDSSKESVVFQKSENVC